MIPITVSLTEFEEDLVHRVATGRNEGKRHTLVRQYLPEGERDVQGFAGELGFCKIFNLYPDLVIGSEIRPDFDCIYRGVKIDVKTAPPGKNLIAQKGKEKHPPEMFALMLGAMPTFQLVGFAPAWMLLREEMITDLTHGPTYFMSRHLLMSFDEAASRLNRGIPTVPADRGTQETWEGWNDRGRSA